MTNERNPGGDASGLMMSLGDETSLTRPENIGALIRRFISGVLDAVSRASDGQISRELGVATVQASCRYYAGILSGRISSKYNVDGAWFPVGLAGHLRKEIGASGSDEDVIAEAFGSIAHHVFAVTELSDEGDAQKGIDDLVRDSMMLLSGLS